MIRNIWHWACLQTNVFVCWIIAETKKCVSGIIQTKRRLNRCKVKNKTEKFLKIAFAAALAVVSGVTAYQAQDKEILSDLALANVEALAMIEDPMEEGGYSSMHIKCFDMYGNSTGKCTATSYWSPIGKGLYHSHSCSYCCN